MKFVIIIFINFISNSIIYLFYFYGVLDCISIRKHIRLKELVW